MICLFLIVVSAVGITSCSNEKVEQLSIMTFNIRLDVESDSLNNWKYRKNNVSQMLNYYEPDLMGFQEVCDNQMQDLKNSLPNYGAIGVGRDDGKSKGEYCPIFYNKRQYTLIQSGNFSLSENPTKIGIKGWDASYNRIATWGLFQNNKSQERFLYYNTHLDNDGVIARREGAKLILKDIRGKGLRIPTFITGDFNCEPNDEPLKIFKEAGFSNSYCDSRIKYGPDYSFHDFDRLPLNERVQLDYILTSEDFIIQKSRTIQDKKGIWNLSDHYPVLVNLSKLDIKD